MNYFSLFFPLSSFDWIFAIADLMNKRLCKFKCWRQWKNKEPRSEHFFSKKNQKQEGELVCLKEKKTSSRSQKRPEFHFLLKEKSRLLYEYYFKFNFLVYCALNCQWDPKFPQYFYHLGHRIFLEKFGGQEWFPMSIIRLK